MEEIAQRLKEVSERCHTAYNAWGKAKKDVSAREELQEAIHELRKVAARLEIEIAVSDRDESAVRAMPIPPHRAARRQGGGNDDAGLPDFISGNGGDDDSDDDAQPKQNQGGQRQGGRDRGPIRHMRRPQGGGQGGGGQNRRPQRDNGNEGY
ncbi:MAG: hypothetical protein GC136_10175 [Alphaproteobacteria bacterium]|nr:hypothetical protein [Alphaproteobacteria bacterium]